MISKRTYGRMEMSEDNLMTVLNADQRYILKTYVGSQGLSLWLDYLVLVQIFLADLILVYWVPRNEGLRA